MYFDNDADNEVFNFMNPLTLADHIFGVPANNSKDLNIELFMSLQGLRQQTFEMQALSLFEKHASNDFGTDSVFYPKSIDDLSRAFANNFLRMAEG